MAAQPRRVLAVVAAALVVLGVAGLIVGALSGSGAPTSASGSSGVLYFTTYQPPTANKVTYHYLNGTFSLGQVTTIATLQAADGMVFAPDGRLLVGEAAFRQVAAVDVGTGTAQIFGSGGNPVFMLSVDPHRSVLYAGGLPGPMSVIPLDPLGAGRTVTVKGDDTVITGVAVAPDGTAVYTASGPDGTGNLGTIDLATFRTHRLISGQPGVHGALYDPFSRSFMAVGGQTIYQLDARRPGDIVSQVTVPGVVMDQGAVDGHGHAFIASNDGRLVFIDYSKTGKVGDLSDLVRLPFLASKLDDVAPLLGAGARPVTSGAPWATPVGIVLLLLGLATGVVLFIQDRRGRRDPLASLPSWDRRRSRSGPTF